VSGKNDNAAHDADLRTLKTRKALLDSLSGLVQERRYDEFAVGDIVEQAEVGRSTFYDHYRSKDDMIVETMAGMLEVMASVASKDGDVSKLETVLRHFQDNKKFARHFFTSNVGLPVMARVTRELARRIEFHLQARCATRGVTGAIPLPLIAAQAAEAQFALIRAWLADDGACSALELAKGMRSSAIGSISALT
jgi:AcrR family transcriptional regulator